MTNTEMGETDESKIYSCFVCNKNSNEKGIPLMISETSYSQICLGKKLQEILGEKLVILLNQKDSVCWKCATFINKYDKFEFELDLIRDYILNSVLEKYNCKYEDLKQVIDDKADGSSIGDLAQFSLEQDQVKSKSSSLYKSSRLSKGDVKTQQRVRFNPSVKVKSDVKSGATSEKKLQEKGNEFECSTCLHSFPSLDIYEKHVKLHNLAKSRFYKCKLCGFSSSNLEMYCRHICSLNHNQFVSCFKCKRSFLESQLQTRADGERLCKQCYERNDIGSIIPGTDVTITHRLPQREEKKVLQSKKPKLVRKLTTEGSIEYEEQSEPVSSLQDITVNRLDTTLPQETFNNDDNPLDAGFNQSDNVVYLYDDKKNKDIEIKVEPEEDNVREIVVPDHLLEQISSKTGRSTPYMLKCSNCDQVMDVRQLPSHKCFLELEAVEFFEVENALEIDMSLTKKEPETDEYSYIDQQFYQNDDIVSIDENDENFQPRLLCKTCFQQFPSITQLREHWQDSGHAWEVGTLNVDVKTIKDKVKDNEQTFKVVKQMFSMKANIPAQNNVVESDYTEEHIYNIKNMFVKVRANNECETCGKMFPNEEIMKDHQVDECLTCVYCGIRFIRNDLLKKHYMCTGHWRKISQDQDPSIRSPLHDTPPCHMCGKEFFTRYNLCMHLKTHYRGTNKGFCHFCFLEFDDKTQILNHIIETHDAQLYKCNHCELSFLTENKRDRHEIVKHKNVECRLCNTKFTSIKKLFRHNDRFHREKSCKVCGQFFKSWQSLERHERRHSYEDSLKCCLCQVSFKNRISLKVHNNDIHKGDFKYYCSTCNIGFTDRVSCVKHRKSHSKNKNVCRRCGKKCVNRTALWNHSKKHVGPYTCDVCSRVLRDTSLLAIHRKKHLKSRPYQCPHCPKSFFMGRQLKRHVTTHRRCYPHRCTLCRRSYTTQQAYNRHMTKVHHIKHPVMSSAVLSLNPTDEDIILAADTLISDDVVILNGYQKEHSTITEVVVETTELFDEMMS